MSYGNNTFQVCKKKSGGKGKSKGKKVKIKKRSKATLSLVKALSPC